MKWEIVNQQSGFDRDINQLGSQLSLEIDCPVRYPAYDKRVFECKCMATFPLFLLKGGDWNSIRQRHKEGG